MESKWISVEERLPEYYDDVLTFNRVGFMHVCYFHFERKQFTRKDNQPITDHLKITHWMPLPEPPKP